MFRSRVPKHHAKFQNIIAFYKYNAVEYIYHSRMILLRISLTESSTIYLSSCFYFSAFLSYLHVIMLFFPTATRFRWVSSGLGPNVSLPAPLNDVLLDVVSGLDDSVVDQTNAWTATRRGGDFKFIYFYSCLSQTCPKGCFSGILHSANQTSPTEENGDSLQQVC